MRDARENGQATVELALCLPLVALLLGVVFELAMVAVDQVRLVHTAREIARAAVVDPDPDVARRVASASGLEPLQIAVDPTAEGRVQGEALTVSLEYVPRSRLPLMDLWVDDIRLRAATTMRIESP